MGKQVSWMWGDKRHYGTLIRETKTHKYARTVNGKVKKNKKAVSYGILGRSMSRM